MDTEDPYIIKSLEELREHYGKPTAMATESMLNYLHDHMIDFIGRSSFIVLSSASEDGFDASPRGGAPGFVKVLDRKTVAFGDWPGNNKLETISNIILGGRCSILFLVPTLDMFLRLKGNAVVTREPQLLEKLPEAGKLPKCAIKLTVDKAYFHCGKAIKRSLIWEPESWSGGEGYPMVGRIMKDLVELPDLTPEQINEMYKTALKEDLY